MVLDSWNLFGSSINRKLHYIPTSRNFPLALIGIVAFAEFCLVFTMKYVSLVNLEIATKIVHCLLWLEDEQSWQSFALTVCTSFSVSQSHIFLRVFLKNVAIQLALKDSSPAFAAFVCMVDHMHGVSVTSSGIGKYSQCVIMKNRDHFEQTRRNFLSWKIELVELVKFATALFKKI